ncbi:cilia- and flagella-associated protein 65-like [Cataglyphis hispanica]|uniref:cilia- and flagella-associated protein 65-like n=1 Tax=Cataglyphis hispanica TaxID=1086592 RepID=UPI0021800779|nr:cilia- and flagella-associated protein 65-like [Cataglyphis hispanica]
MCCEGPRKIYVEFGEVEVDATAIKWIEIINESCMEQIYEARRDATTNPLDHVFELCSYSWSLLPGQIYKCKIYYRPFVPSSVNIDYFTIVDSVGERAEIKVCGMCIGPVISLSTTRLIMICTSEKREIKKRIKLVNDSKAMAIFMFDIDLTQRSFKVDTKQGCIGSHSRKYVMITFAPQEAGIYTCHLPCLILNHRPIIIEVYGYCSSMLLHKINIQNRFNYPEKLKNGFESYMSDTIVAAQDVPAISLSKNYIDFGQADLTENTTQKISETLCLTNHTRSDVLIKWDQDIEEIFDIIPVITKVPAGQTVLFEVTFSPDKGSNLFAREFIGYVFTDQQENLFYQENVVFPVITSVRLIGHSFPICSDGWIPQYEIPHIVKMPPCLPSFPIYTTFLIKKFGHLPLMYRFIPPTSSHFFVKPMMGIIHKDYQIIVVGMLPGIDNERVYVERWAIHFNGNTKSEYFIDFRGFAECANVSFRDQIVRFAPTFPNCQEPQQFYMRNITRHTINYEFVNMTPELQIRNKNNKIFSNDIFFLEWIFCPATIGNYEFDVKCILFILRDKIPTGPSVCITLHVIGSCESGYLVSAPDELNFGVQAYKATKELNFHIFNLSPVDIHYEITCSHCNWPIGNIEHDVKIQPIMDTVFAGQDKMITVSLTPTTPGYYELFLQYFVRLNINTIALIPNQMPRNICKLCSLCVLPTLKVTNLQCYGPYPDMSKAFLWKLMKINIFNTLLQDLQAETSQTLYINFPAMILHESPFIIKLLLRNVTAVIASWNIKRVQLCSCRPIFKGFSLQRAKYDCLHRKVCSVQPKTGNLKPGEENWITLELHYVLLGKTESKWDLDLGNNRHIFFLIVIEGLSSSVNKLHLLNGTHFKFQHIYLGDKSPIYQVCWVHNGTNHSIPFSVNPRTVREINQQYCYEVFSCATRYAIVNPQSSVPILLKFQPRQFGTFKGRLCLTLGDEEEELILEGESSLPHKPAAIGEYIPSESHDIDDDIPIYFNADCIDILHVATHSHVIKMIMMHNNLVQDVLAFEWKRNDIPGVIHVEVHPQKGLIKPMSVKSFQVAINTEEYPCVIDLNIPCEFINTSQRRAYQRSVYKLEDMSRELKGQFTITEKGVSVPKPLMKVLEKPQTFYKTITIRCSIYSMEDKFLKISLMDELINAPPKRICIEKNDRQILTFGKKDINRSSFIIEGLLWEIVNSKIFKNIMQDILRNESNLFYSQFTMNLYERKRLIRRSYISSPRALINRILERMLFIILHQEFALKTAHLIQHKDIRHKNYLNIISGMNRRKIAKQGIEILYFILRKHCLIVLIVAICFRKTVVMSR